MLVARHQAVVVGTEFLPLVECLSHTEALDMLFFCLTLYLVTCLIWHFFMLRSSIELLIYSLRLDSRSSKKKTVRGQRKTEIYARS